MDSISAQWFMGMAYATRPESSLTSVTRNAFSERKTEEKTFIYLTSLGWQSKNLIKKKASRKKWMLYVIITINSSSLLFSSYPGDLLGITYCADSGGSPMIFPKCFRSFQLSSRGILNIDETSMITLQYFSI